MKLLLFFKAEHHYVHWYISLENAYSLLVDGICTPGVDIVQDVCHYFNLVKQS